MENDSNCVLTCKHSFCKGCVKEWYTKGNSSCPMCRANICFRGFSSAVNRWRQEKVEQKLQDVYTEAFEYIITDDLELSEYSESEYSDDPEDDPEDDPGGVTEGVTRAPSPTQGEEYESESESDSEYSVNFNFQQFLKPINKMHAIIEMEKKFNKVKNDLEPDELLEFILDPYNEVQMVADHYAYEVTPARKFISKKNTTPNIRGLSQKRRRQRSGSAAITFSNIQMLGLEQLFIIM